MAYYAFTYPNWASTVRNVIHQSEEGSIMGMRGTPIIGFYPMRKQWERQPAYWETLGHDGDVLMQTGIHVIPATYRLVYFKIPGANLVCQLAYETSPGKITAWDDEDGARINYVGYQELRDAILQKRAIQ